jgi:hypothetical protein
MTELDRARSFAASWSSATVAIWQTICNIPKIQPACPLKIKARLNDPCLTILTKTDLTRGNATLRSMSRWAFYAVGDSSFLGPQFLDPHVAGRLLQHPQRGALWADRSCALGWGNSLTRWRTYTGSRSCTAISSHITSSLQAKGC